MDNKECIEKLQGSLDKGEMVARDISLRALDHAISVLERVSVDKIEHIVGKSSLAWQGDKHTRIANSLYVSMLAKAVCEYLGKENKL